MSLTPPDVDLAARVSVRLLGGFKVTVGGRSLDDDDWPSLRSEHLVQLLAMAPQHRLTREQVIDCLWPHLDPDAAAANLRKAAHHARQALGRQDGVVLQGGKVLLAPVSGLAVDAADFERAAQAALQRDDAPACATASALYTGDLLPGARYEPWTEAPRERLRDLQARLLRTAGRWEALVELEPTDEPAHRALMAQALAGSNRALAIRWYARLRAALRQELGARPDDTTQALYLRAIQGLERSRPALVGRAMVRARLDAWASLPPRGRPAGLYVRGPAGIGKTALGREFADDLRTAGWTVAEVAAALPGRPYAALTAAAEPLILSRPDVLDRIGPAARSVLAMLTPLAEPAAPLPGPLGRHQVIGALRRLLLAASGGGDVLLQIDDAHWLDRAELDVVLHLASSGAPLHVWLAARPPAAGSPLAVGAQRLMAAGRLQAVDLEPLSADEVRALLAQAAAGPLVPETVERIVSLADGNPFAALELLRAADAPGRLPASVAEVIAARLVDLPNESIDLLRRLALAHDSFDTAMAAALTLRDGEQAEAQADAMLDAALASGVLVVDDARYRFRHELVRQALIEQVPPHRRARLHREIAAALAALDAPPALVARHWLDGGSVAEAVPWLLDAALEALRMAAFSDTLRHLEPVLAHAPGHAQALHLRAEALDALGDPQAMAAYRAAADAEPGPLAEDLRVKAALAQIKQGDPKGGVQALQGLAPSTPEGRLAEALAYSGAAALGAVDPAVGSAKSAEARRLALQSGDTAALVIASWAHAAAAHARGELHRTVQADLRDTQQLPYLAVRVFDGQLCMVQRFLYGARPYAEVIAFAQALADEARRLGAARGEAFGITIRGEAELLAGDLDAAERDLQHGAAMHRAIGAATGESFALQRLAEASIYRGRLDEAHARLEQALDLARQTDVGFHLLDRIYGTRIALADLEGQGRHALDEAQDAVRGPLETCPGCRITFTVPAAIAAARAGDVPRAEALAGQSAYLANVVMRLPAWHAAHHEVEGHLALARGEGAAAARRHFEDAAAAFEAAEHPLDAARCLAQGRALGGAG